MFCQNLKKTGFRATGMIRENRLNNCPVTPIKQIKKEERGTYVSAFDEENGIAVVRWNDNSVVTMSTNFDTIDPPSMIKRY